MNIGIDNYSYHRFLGEVYPGQLAPSQAWRLSAFVDHILSLDYLPLVESLSIETCFIDDSDQVNEQFSRLPVPVLFGWGHPHGFMEIDLATAKREIEAYLQMSRSFGAEVMRITGSSINYFEQPHTGQLEKTKRYLEQILPLAAEYGVKLAIENHGDFYLEELAEILDYFSSPYLGLTLDTGNCLRLDQTPSQAIQMFQDRVLIIHAKDVAIQNGFAANDPRRYACVPAGKGEVNFPSLFNDLQAVEYRRPVLVEISRMHPLYEHEGEEAMIRESIRYLHAIRAELELDHG